MNEYFVILDENNYISSVVFEETQESIAISNETLKKIMQNEVNYYENNTFIYKEKEKSLDELKEQKLNELEIIKTNIENSDILYQSIEDKKANKEAKYYQADNKAKELLTQSLLIFSSVGLVPENFSWKASDNSLNVFSLDDLKLLSLSIAQRLQNITMKYWQYKEQIRNANNKDEIINLRIEL